jgi:hypothetical protein
MQFGPDQRVDGTCCAVRHGWWWSKISVETSDNATCLFLAHSTGAVWMVFSQLR